MWAVWLYLLYPEDKCYNVVGEVCPITEGFEFLEIVLAVAWSHKVMALTYVFTIEAQPERISGPLRVMVCQIRRDRTVLLILPNWDQKDRLGLRWRVRRKNCHSSIAARIARK